MWKQRIKGGALAAVWTLVPVAAWAHGDDEIRWNSFVGPLLTLLTLLILVPLGKALLAGRGWKEKRP